MREDLLILACSMLKDALKEVEQGNMETAETLQAYATDVMEMVEDLSVPTV